MHSPQRQRILVIDDDASFRESVQLVLDSEGYDVTTAGGCEEALDECTRLLPDLVICDILMPGKDGLEAIKSLRVSYPELRIVAITGGGEYGIYDLSSVACQLGADRALLKPIEADELLNCVREALGDGAP